MDSERDAKPLADSVGAPQVSTDELNRRRRQAEEKAQYAMGAVADASGSCGTATGFAQRHPHDIDGRLKDKLNEQLRAIEHTRRMIDLFEQSDVRRVYCRLLDMGLVCPL